MPTKEIPSPNSSAAANDQLHWVGVSENKFYRISNSRNGEYHAHEIPWDDIIDEARKLLRLIKEIKSNGKIINN